MTDTTSADLTASMVVERQLGVRRHVETMAELYKAGHTLKEIGTKYGVTRERIRQILSDHGITADMRPNLRARRVLDAYSPDRTITQIASAAGESYSTSRTVLRRNGLKARKAPKRRCLYTNEALLDHLRTLAKQLGKTPAVRDLTKNPGPSHTNYYRQFGSLRKAQELVGLEPNNLGGRLYPGPRRPLTDDELLEHLNGMARDLGKLPSMADLRRTPGPSEYCYRQRFGSLHRALELAGILTNGRGRIGKRGCRHQYSDAELLDSLRTLTEHLGKLPSRVDVKNSNGPCVSTYAKRFGTLKKALFRALVRPAVPAEATT